MLMAVGLNMRADFMEFVLLTFLSLTLQVEFDLTDQEAATLTSAVFVGALIGTLTLGPLADDFGQKPIFIDSGVLIELCGIACSLVQNYRTLFVLRFGVGFGIGGELNGRCIYCRLHC